MTRPAGRGLLWGLYGPRLWPHGVGAIGLLAIGLVAGLLPAVRRTDPAHDLSTICTSSWCAATPPLLVRQIFIFCFFTSCASTCPFSEFASEVCGMALFTVAPTVMQIIRAGVGHRPRTEQTAAPWA